MRSQKCDVMCSQQGDVFEMPLDVPLDVIIKCWCVQNHL